MPINLYILDDSSFKVAWIPDLLKELNGSGIETFCFGFAEKFSAVTEWLTKGHDWFAKAGYDLLVSFTTANNALFDHALLAAALKDSSSIWLIDLDFSRAPSTCDLNTLYSNLYNEFNLTDNDEHNIIELTRQLLGTPENLASRLGVLMCVVRHHLGLPYFVVSRVVHESFVKEAMLPGFAWPSDDDRQRTHESILSGMIQPAAEKIRRCARGNPEDLIQALVYVGAVGLSQHIEEFGHVEWESICDYICKGQAPVPFPSKLHSLLSSLRDSSTAASKALFCKRGGAPAFDESPCCVIPRDSADRMPIETFIAILDFYSIQCSHEGFIDANGQTSRYLCLPASPGIVFFIRLVEFLRNGLNVRACHISTGAGDSDNVACPIVLKIPIRNAKHFQAAFYTRLPGENGEAVVSFRRLLACRVLKDVELEGICGRIKEASERNGAENIFFNQAIAQIAAWQTKEPNSHIDDGHRAVLIPVVRHVFNANSIEIIWDRGAPKAGRGIK